MPSCSPLALRKRVLSRASKRTRSNVTEPSALTKEARFSPIHIHTIHPPASLWWRLSVEAHTTVGVAANDRARVGSERKEDRFKPPGEIPEAARLLSRAKISHYATCAARHFSRAAKKFGDEGRVSVQAYAACILDFADAIITLGVEDIREALTELVLGVQEDTRRGTPTKCRVRFIPPCTTMGGLWVDLRFVIQCALPFVIGEANFSDHGRNRLVASALYLPVPGLDGYFCYGQTLAE